MFNRKAEKSFEIISNMTAKTNQAQFAFRKASLAVWKSIFFEIYQKQIIVTPIFNSNFRYLLSFDSCLITDSSILFYDSDEIITCRSKIIRASKRKRNE